MEIYEKAYQALPEYSYSNPNKVRYYLSWLWRGDPNGFWVAFWENQIVAFIGVHGSWLGKNGRIGEIHELVVCPEYQAKGVATALLEKAFAYCASLGRRRIGLWVGEKNQLALRLYLKHGFKETGQWGKWVRMEKEVI